MFLAGTARPIVKIFCALASTAWLVLGAAAVSHAQDERPTADIDFEVLAPDGVLAPDRVLAPDEIPEEVLRTEIITAARSPLTGEPLSAAEYAQLLETLQAPTGDTLVNQQIRYLVFLLQIRRSIRPIVPFL